jgi:hypothetical protein
VGESEEYSSILTEAFRRRMDWKASQGKGGDGGDGSREEWKHGLEYWVYGVTKERVSGRPS